MCIPTPSSEDTRKPTIIPEILAVKKDKAGKWLIVDFKIDGQGEPELEEWEFEHCQARGREFRRAPLAPVMAVVILHRARAWPMQTETGRLPGWADNDHSSGKTHGGFTARGARKANPQRAEPPSCGQ